MTRSDPVRLFLIDDHALFREGLARLLDSEPDFEVCGRASSIAAAVPLLEPARPDVILLDLDLGSERGGTLFRHPVLASTGAKVLVVTAGASAQEAVDLVEGGAAGIFHKHKPPQQLCEAIRQVASGSAVLEQEYLQPLLRGGERVEQRAKLTDREIRILRCIFQGMANKEIADEIHAAESTVKAALRVMFDKLNVRTRSQLVRVALERYRDQL